MSLFKVFWGPEEELQEVPCKNGYAYFTTDQGNLYIDIADGTADEADTKRKKVSGKYAEALRKVDPDNPDKPEYIEIDDIALKSMVYTKEEIDQMIGSGGSSIQIFEGRFDQSSFEPEYYDETTQLYYYTYSVKIPNLTCGKDGKTPPIVIFNSNSNSEKAAQYSIVKAVAEPGLIKFYKPSSNALGGAGDYFGGIPFKVIDNY